LFKNRFLFSKEFTWHRFFQELNQYFPRTKFLTYFREICFAKDRAKVLPIIWYFPKQYFIYETYRPTLQFTFHTNACLAQITELSSADLLININVSNIHDIGITINKTVNSTRYEKYNWLPCLLGTIYLNL